MMIRLIAWRLCLLPTAAPGQHSIPPGAGESKRCTEGQIIDTTSKSCIADSV